MHTHVPAAGEVVWIRQRRWRVRRATRRDDVVRLEVGARHDRVTFLAPPDRPSVLAGPARHRRVRAQSARARLAHLLARRHGIRTLGAAIGARVDLLPHQLEPALALLHGAGRLLIADAVGLGKTIQAGLAIAEVIRRRPLARILVVVPAALADQWRDELDRRFSLSVMLADRAGLDALARGGLRGDNPWRRPGVWLASLDFLKQSYVLGGLPARPWDLVVFDEAHTACGDSTRHDAADALARRARHVILLTATPHDGDPERFTRLLALGRIGSDDGDPLTVFRRTRADVRAEGQRRVRWHGVTPGDAEAALLRALFSFEAAALVAAGPARRDAALLLLSIFRKRAASTMRALSITLERREGWLTRSNDAPPDWLQPSLVFDDDLAADDVMAGEPRALTSDIGIDPRKELAWIRRLRTLAIAAERRECKLVRLGALLGRTSEAVIVFTEFRHSLEAVRRAVSSIRDVATLHGGQTPAGRAAELARFLTGGASALIATDVASLGLNLQHRSRWVIALELPWNPARLEQRLGRIDRIGQTRPVHMTLLVGRHAAEAGVLSRLARRALTARRAIGEDVMADIVPSEGRMREGLIAGVDLDDAAAGPADPLPSCRRWRRPARQAAASLARQRRLANQWRASDADAGRTRVARSSLAAGTGGLLIFVAPILDGSGAALEEHVVAVRIPREHEASPARGATIAAAGDLARQSLSARVRRVQWWLRAPLRAGLARERAMAIGDDADRLTEAQPGLFDRRVVEAFDAARAAADEEHADAMRRIDEWRASTLVTIGRPVLALMLVAR